MVGDLVRSMEGLRQGLVYEVGVEAVAAVVDYLLSDWNCG